MRNIIIRKLGKCYYHDIFQKMKAFTTRRDINTTDELWLLEHFPVFTQGYTASKDENLLNPGNIPIVLTDRGGKITYHGPGQLIIYVLIDLKQLKIGPKKLVLILEQSVIQTLNAYNIEASTISQMPGIYVNGAKICSLGLRIRQGFTYHGLALNIDMDISPFSMINPCGIKNLTVTQMSCFIENPNWCEIERKICERLMVNLGFNCSQELDF